MNLSFEELEALSDVELRERFTDVTTRSPQSHETATFYLDELQRRETRRQTATMLSLTRTVARLTWAIGVMTAANIVLVAVSIL